MSKLVVSSVEMACDGCGRTFNYGGDLKRNADVACPYCGHVCLFVPIPGTKTVQSVVDVGTSAEPASKEVELGGVAKKV